MTQANTKLAKHAFLRGLIARGVALTIAFGAWAPAVADPDLPTINGDTSTFSGNQSLGIDRTNTNADPFTGVGAFPHTIQLQSLTQTITPGFALDGVHFESEQGALVNPDLMLTLDSTTHIDVEAAHGVFVRAQGVSLSSEALGVNVSVDSSANITLNTIRPDLSRAELTGQQGARDAALQNVENAQLALNYMTGQDTSSAALAAMDAVNCQLNNPAPFLISCPSGLIPPPNPKTFIPELYDLIYTQQALYDHLNSPPSPLEVFSTNPDQAGTSLGALTVLNVDGDGGQTGVPGTTTVTNRGVLNTSGANGAGILAQSLGAPARASSDGGSISVFNYGAINTTGATSPAIFALSAGSVSDSGGNGGLVQVTGTAPLTTQGAYSYGAYAVSVGGDGANNQGIGGAGGTVIIDYNGNVTTHGNFASGLAGTSLGGDGPKGKDADLGVGGTNQQANPGGVAGNGGSASATLEAGHSITTSGVDASGIEVLSQGGSGGRGGSGNISHDGASGGPGGNGGLVAATNYGTISTIGHDAYGILAQSLAGNGGGGGNDSGFLFDYGGAGGAAGGGSTVTVQNYGLIQTAGARSYGVLAQSIGGIGGAGGSATDVFGAEGGRGGSAQTVACQVFGQCPNGGQVTIDNYGGILTSGEAAYAVLAQSIGGGGGQGGDGSGWINIAGGEGGDAGRGDIVRVDNHSLASIDVTGDRAAGIVAQSIGGGGGNGGDANSGGPYASLSIGGNAGAGGNGSEVHVTNDGSMVASGERDNAIIAQSIGGGGGIGGSATAFSVSGFAAASITIGGSGGSGGGADLAEVINNGDIATHGDFSNAILAQSIGGGGGLGGSAYSFSASASPEDFSLSTSVAVGGKGGDGGDGGDVHVANAGNITTYDWNSFGILAQSIGGGGGNGGASTAEAVTAMGGEGTSFDVSIAVGGSGGTGAHAGQTVAIENTGSIFTLGDSSTGILAQSIGGGGGNGGDATTTTAAFSGGDSSSLQLKVSIGGGAGDGGDGGQVTVTNSTRGNIVTLGWMANGITAQSIGGGGGTGGAGDQGSLFGDLDIPTQPPDFEDDGTNGDRDKARQEFGELQKESRDAPKSGEGREGHEKGKSESVSIDVGISIGGNGGKGGAANTVTVTNNGEILAGGFMSMGVFAQAVGGGGGAGGGGTGSASGDVGLGAGIGGAGNEAGNGGQVFVYNAGSISTLQALSYGIFAQSVGGGGGLAGVGAGQGDVQSGLNFSLGMGQGGGDGGDGELVHVEQAGDIATLGYAAIGLAAQSVGGGGGVGGSAQQGSVLSVALGGNGGTANNGGDVYVKLDGNIGTEGAYAFGILAQSVGGGGGLAGGVDTQAFTYGVDPFGLLNVNTGLTVSVANVGIGGSGGQGGNGGNIQIVSNGAISTFGAGAHGIFAQSIGGGGGNGGSGGATFPAAIGLAGSNGDGGTAGTITIDYTGKVHTSGAGAAGIYAQSMAGDQSGLGGNIAITLHGGEIVGGSGNAGVGVFMSGGDSNTIDNRGGSISAASGVAIAATDGDDTVLNAGLIAGSVGLGGGHNAFTNEVGGTFQSGTGVYLGAGGVLSNSGVLSPFGSAIGHTTVAGNYTQTAAGVLRVDLDLTTSQSDLVTVQGTASLAGGIQPVFAHVTDLHPGSFTTILTANTINDQGISINSADTLALHYTSRIVGNALQIGVDKVNFVIDGLSPSEQVLAKHFQDIWAGGDLGGVAKVADYLAGQKNGDAYAGLLDSLNPHGALSDGVEPMTVGQTILGGLMSCPGQAEDADFREHDCKWVRASQVSAKQNPTADAPGYRDETGMLQAGAQTEIVPDWFAGFTMAIASSDFRSPGFSVGGANTFGLGGVVKHEIGDLLVAGGVEYARSKADHTRFIGAPVNENAHSHTDTDFLALRLRASYVGHSGDFYLRPLVDVDEYEMHTGAFHETGAGPLDLEVEGSTRSIVGGSVSLEGGANSVQADGRVLRPYALVGVTAIDRDNLDLMAHFEGDPAGISDFPIANAIPKELVRTELGFEALWHGGALRVAYDRRSGDRYSD